MGKRGADCVRSEIRHENFIPFPWILESGRATSSSLGPSPTSAGSMKEEQHECGKAREQTDTESELLGFDGDFGGPDHRRGNYVIHGRGHRHDGHRRGAGVPAVPGADHYQHFPDCDPGRYGAHHRRPLPLLQPSAGKNAGYDLPAVTYHDERGSGPVCPELCLVSGQHHHGTGPAHCGNCDSHLLLYHQPGGNQVRSRSEQDHERGPDRRPAAVYRFRPAKGGYRLCD